MKLISVVTPCFNEEKNIKRCYLKVKSIFSEYLGQYKYEHIICDNYSNDSMFRVFISPHHLSKNHYDKSE